VCGIAGMVFAPPGADADMETAVQTLSHRGPDVRRVLRVKGACLAHARLSVLDLREVANQPMVLGDLVLVYNGEIYNHAVLRRELERRGHVFVTRSDTEVLLHGYRAWGPDVVHRLDGMFAFGLFDGARRRLVMATDRAGKKPLFYTRQGSFVRFASEAKALFAMGHKVEVDPRQLPLLLSFGYLPAPQTLHAGVAQLPPATVVTVDEDGTWSERRYWSPPFAEPTSRVDVETATHEVRRRVVAAVERRLEADVPLGAFLSGGLDSSIIAAVMQKALGNLRTFSIGFAGDARYDETVYAREVANALGTSHTEHVVGPEVADLVPDLIWAHDGPFGDSSALPTSVVSALARQHVTVALTGDGGDESFCGYTRLLAAELSSFVPEAARGALSLAEQVLPKAQQERGLVSRATRFVAGVHRPLAERLVGYSPYFGNQLASMLAPDLLSTEALQQAVRYTEEILGRTQGAPPLASILNHNFTTYLPFDLLVKADRSSMLHGLELRSPFLDLQVVEFAARLPHRFLRRGFSTKWILRRAFRDLIPGSVLRRPKMGFGVPLTTWFRGPLKSLLCDTLGPGALCHQFFAPGAVEALLRQHQRMEADHTHRLWLLLTLELWLKRVRDGAPWERPGIVAGAPAARRLSTP
jgi:asparagine synthase (glutamine-hydrolysing)